MVVRGWKWDCPMISSRNNAIFGAMQLLMRQSSAKMLSARKECLVLAALLLLSASQAAHANQCLTNGPRYQLELDFVEWRMKIHSNENCVRGVRFSYVWNATVRLVSPPKIGQVAVVGPGFSYTAKSDFHGKIICGRRIGFQEKDEWVFDQFAWWSPLWTPRKRSQLPLRILKPIEPLRRRVTGSAKTTDVAYMALLI